ncbi:tetratricopeptide repeat protein [Pseudanabaena sp. FACHB-2040]|uniref:tetratricopeptide repeat protein n=1 Tax=Pseudanabaena sp. FACHB-2040 TaxID=2692859 RepID=UPI0016831B59|nr:tetratricopeptide repeat protein [Pseudanabaena sp. FACHB-2040]MBD2259089.1 tetratricopeptide repeat protein [Pseudanabaena sp. FACHB-2040]
MKIVKNLAWGCVLTASLVGSGFGPARGAELEQQLDIRPFNATGGQARDVADQWNQLGQQQAAAGQPSQATASWFRAAEIYGALGDTVAEGKIYDAIGLSYIELGRYREAEPLLRRRIAIARDNRDLLGVVYGLNNLGTLLIRDNQVAAAETFFTEGLQIAEAIPSPTGIGLSLSNLGLIAALRSDLASATQYLEAAANYRILTGDTLGEANSSNGLGDVYRALDRDRNAIGAYRVALRLGSESNNRPIQIRALDGLLAVYLKQGDWANFRTHLDQRTALTADRQRPDEQTVTNLTWLGEYYERTGAVAAAQETYSRALALARSLDMQTQAVGLTNRLIQLR